MEEIIKIKQMLKDGKDFDFISKVIDCSPTFISNINHGIYYKNENEIYPIRKFYKEKEEYSELIDLLLNTDLTFSEISKKLKIGYSTIKKINAGTLIHGLYHSYPIRKTSTRQQKANKIKRMLKEGKSNLEIIKECGVSEMTIYRINNGETYYDSSLTYPLR